MISYKADIGWIQNDSSPPYVWTSDISLVAGDYLFAIFEYNYGNDVQLSSGWELEYNDYDEFIAIATKRIEEDESGSRTILSVTTGNSRPFVGFIGALEGAANPSFAGSAVFGPDHGLDFPQSFPELVITDDDCMVMRFCCGQKLNASGDNILPTLPTSGHTQRGSYQIWTNYWTVGRTKRWGLATQDALSDAGTIAAVEDTIHTGHDGAGGNSHFYVTFAITNAEALQPPPINVPPETRAGTFGRVKSG